MGPCGVAFVLTPSSSGAKYSYRVIYAFQGGPEGAGSPVGTLLRDDEGNLYGTSESPATVFELRPKGSGYVEQVLLAAGTQLSPGLSRDGNGALYGATPGGASGGGTVFKLTPNGSQYTFSTVFEFQQSTGSFPVAGPIVDAAGALYGTTQAGGSGTFGTVYELTPGGSTYRETVLHDFAGGSDGESPSFGQLSFVDGSIYGTTPFGGGGPCSAYMRNYGCGTIFALTPSGSGYVYDTIYRFEGQADGEEPAPGLVLGAKGRFYGTTSGGGYDYEQPTPGTIYELSTVGSSVTLQSIHVFPYAKFRSGVLPNGAIIFGRPGVLFGTTELGGNARNGTVFSMQV